MADPLRHDSRIERDQVVDERPTARPAVVVSIIAVATLIVALAFYASLE
jgi:hypothetical protein